MKDLHATEIKRTITGRENVRECTCLHRILNENSEAFHAMQLRVEEDRKLGNEITREAWCLFKAKLFEEMSDRHWRVIKGSVGGLEKSNDILREAQETR